MSSFSFEFSLSHSHSFLYIFLNHIFLKNLQVIESRLAARALHCLTVYLLFVIIYFVFTSQPGIYLAKPVDLYSQQDPLILDTSAESIGKFLFSMQPEPYAMEETFRSKCFGKTVIRSYYMALVWINQNIYCVWLLHVSTKRLLAYIL